MPSQLAFFFFTGTDSVVPSPLSPLLSPPLFLRGPCESIRLPPKVLFLASPNPVKQISSYSHPPPPSVFGCVPLVDPPPPWENVHPPPFFFFLPLLDLNKRCSCLAPKSHPPFFSWAAAWPATFSPRVVGIAAPH